MDVVTEEEADEEGEEHADGGTKHDDEETKTIAKDHASEPHGRARRDEDHWEDSQ